MKAAPKSDHAPLRLEYLDGIRAVAALYVSLFHALLTATWPNEYAPATTALPTWLARDVQVLGGGHFGVSVFIILSGYCLMLPVARRHEARLPGGTLAFLGRRARRLLPPYYAALACSLLLTRAPGFERLTGERWDQALPVWEPGVLWSHLLLVQNWSSAWFFKIDMPVWSVATEWQIYWIFALALLPLARRFGVLATAALALAQGLGVHLYYHGDYDLFYYSFIGLFAVGMVGAVVSFSGVSWARRARERLPWGWFAASTWMSFVALTGWLGWTWTLGRVWFMDLLVGAGTCCFLVYCTRALGQAAPPRALRLFQARWLVLVGGFSYSYYLVHDPVLNVLHFTLVPYGLSITTTLSVMLVACVPLCIAVSYLFHLVFERPFMPGHPHTLEKAAHAAVLSPAP